MSKLLKLSTKQNKNIKIGDRILLIDGSSLHAETTKEKCYIVHSHDDITGSNLPLKDIEGEVLKINEPYYSDPRISNYLYHCDLLIKLGKGEFRTSSSMVYKINK